MGIFHFSSHAERDVYEISEFIARDNPHAAGRWVVKVQSTCERLAEFPELGERHRDVRIPDCRLFTVGDYIIFYQPVPDGVVIARVIHGSQNWRS